MDKWLESGEKVLWLAQKCFFGVPSFDCSPENWVKLVRNFFPVGDSLSQIVILKCTVEIGLRFLRILILMQVREYLIIMVKPASKAILKIFVEMFSLDADILKSTFSPSR